MQTSTNDYWKLFKPAACSIRLKGGTQAEIFEELVQNLVKAKSLPPERFDDAVKALREREALASTGVGQNVAIPHVKLAGLDEAVFSLSIHHEGVEWNALDGELVHVFFTVLRPDRAGARHNPDRHLDMMRWISLLGREADFRNFARSAKTRTELVELLQEMSPGR